MCIELEFTDNFSDNIIIDLDTFTSEHFVGLFIITLVVTLETIYMKYKVL